MSSRLFKLNYIFTDIGFVLRKVGNNTTANEEWIIEGDDITVKFTSTFKNKTLKFKLGVEIDEETLDGRNVKVSIITIIITIIILLMITIMIKIIIARNNDNNK